MSTLLRTALGDSAVIGIVFFFVCYIAANAFTAGVTKHFELVCNCAYAALSIFAAMLCGFIFIGYRRDDGGVEEDGNAPSSDANGGSTWLSKVSWAQERCLPPLKKIGTFVGTLSNPVRAAAFNLSLEVIELLANLVKDFLRSYEKGDRARVVEEAEAPATIPTAVIPANSSGAPGELLEPLVPRGTGAPWEAFAGAADDSVGHAVQALAEAGGRARLVAEALFQVGELALSSSEEREALKRCGVAHLVVAAMTTHDGNEEVQWRACAAIANLAYNSLTSKDALVNAGAAKRIVAAMRAHSDSGDLQLEACRASANLPQRSDARRQALARAGVIETAAVAMRVHPNRVELQGHACRLFGNLAYGSDDRREAIMAARVPELVAAAMRTHHVDATVQNYACWALRNLANGSEERKAALIAANAAPLIAAAMRAHPTHVQVQLEGCGAIQSLAAGSDVIKRVLKEKGAVELVKAAMRQIPDHASVQEVGKGAMSALLT